MHNLFEISSITLFLCAFCAFCASLRLKIRLPREIVKSYLTGVKSAFIIRGNPLLTNDLRARKALYNCRETFTDVMSALQIGPFCSNKPNFRKSQMNVSKVITTDYDNMDTWSIGKNKPNSNPIQTQSNPIKAQKMQKQTQFKPKQTQFQRTNFKGMNNQSSIEPFADSLLLRDGSVFEMPSTARLRSSHRFKESGVGISWYCGKLCAGRFYPVFSAGMNRFFTSLLKNMSNDIRPGFFGNN
jgi:hypothetical protein